VREGGDLGGVAQARTLRKAKREKKKESYRGQEASHAARASFFLSALSDSRSQKSVESKAEIQDTLKRAMKSGDRVAVSTLRLLLSAIQNEEIRVRKELGAEEITKTISTLCKQRIEAMTLFRKGGREELAQKEETELKLLQSLLPEPLTDEEIRILIRNSIAEADAKGAKDLGRVMRLVMPKVSGRCDGKRVNELVKELLGG